MVEEEVKWDSEEKYFEEGNFQDRPKKLNEKIIDWCMKGDTYHLGKYLDDKDTKILKEDSNGWTPLQWAVVQNQVATVKLILDYFNEKKNLIKQKKKLEEIEDGVEGEENQEEKQGEEEEEAVATSEKNSSVNILNQNSSSPGVASTDKTDDSEQNFDEIFKKPSNTAENKSSPLHWAAYKGLRRMVSMLLKYKYSPLDIDMYGNTSLHQATASNNIEMVKVFMGLGMELDIKNSRSHTPVELASNPEVIELLKKSLEKNRCSICNVLFNFFVKKYLCFVNLEIICKNCCESNYYYEDEKSEEAEILECRCKNCNEIINKEEEELRKLILKQDLDAIEVQFKKIKENNTKINPKLVVQTVAEIDKLQRQREIANKISGLENVKDHKTIEKSVFMLLNDLKEAEAHGVVIDSKIIDGVIHQKERKIAEKELRKLLSNVTIFNASNELKEELSEKLRIAQEKGVDKEFLDTGNALLEKVCLYLNYMDVYTKLATYPPRVYIPKDPNDKKKKKPEPKSKKKKKKDIFPKPEWAVTSKDVKEKVDEYKKFLAMGEDIGITVEHAEKSKELFARFKLEIAHLKDEEEELRLIEEEKAKKAKKKGGK